MLLKSSTEHPDLVGLLGLACKPFNMGHRQKRTLFTTSDLEKIALVDETDLVEVSDGVGMLIQGYN